MTPAPPAVTQKLINKYLIFTTGEHKNEYPEVVQVLLRCIY